MHVDTYLPTSLFRHEELRALIEEMPGGDMAKLKQEFKNKVSTYVINRYVGTGTCVLNHKN